MPRAELDLDAIYVEHSVAAFRWFNGLERALFTLEEHPARCPFTAENSHLRHLLYGKKPHSYRVIFRVLEESRDVQILHIRHGARRAFQPKDLK
jgi:plasmid stabilization system protein ParE